MIHPQNIFLVVCQFLFVVFSLINCRAKIFGLCYPFGVDTIHATNLPPTFAANDMLQFLRTKPVYQDVGC
jgi:hypothetical protein